MTTLVYDSLVFDDVIFGGSGEIYDPLVFDSALFDTGTKADTVIKAFVNNAWVRGSLQYYNGSIWTQGVLYRYTGGSWVAVNTLGTAVIANITVNPNSWGDVCVKWTGGEFRGQYKAELIDTSNSTVVSTKYTYDTKAFFELEQTLPYWGFAPSYFRVRITAVGPEISTTWEGSLGAVDDSWVKKVVLFGGQSNCQGHLTFLSDPLNTGRKDRVSGAAIRRSLATTLGYQYAEVMPVDLTAGDSAIDKLADVNSPTGTNYWYDLDSDADGPLLTTFLNGAAPYAGRVLGIVWAQGETDTISSYAGGSRVSTTTRWTNATNAVMNRIRQLVFDSQAPIVMQIMGRSWINGSERNGVEWQNYRNAQRSLITARSDVVLATWSDGAEFSTGYVDGIHYAYTTYQNMVTKICDSILNRTDLIGSPPVWVDMLPITTGTAVRNGSNDIVISWGATGYTQYSFTNINVSDGSNLDQLTQASTTYTFTSAQQVAAYGFNTTIADFVVSGYNSVLGVQGPGVTYYINT